jgi:DNA-binding LytR/AlgR family response regulator
MLPKRAEPLSLPPLAPYLTAMPARIDQQPGRERLRLWCALAFWAVTYLLFVAWNQLQDQFPSAIWQTRRLLATGAGSLLFFGFTWLADRLATRPAGERVRILGLAGFACLIAMVPIREAIDHLILPVIGEPLSTVQRHVRFTLIWGGYFAGGALAFLSFASAPHWAAQPVAEQPVEAEPQPSYPSALWVSRGRETARVPIEAIDWIEAEGDYVRLHARTGGGLLRGTLTRLEETLDPSLFVRVHRSAICRRSAICAMLRKPSGALAVRLDTGDEVPVGRRHRDAVAALVTPIRERVPA